MDLDTSVMQSHSALHSNKKLKQEQVADCNLMLVDGEEDPSEVLDGNPQQHIKDVGNSANFNGSAESGDQLKGSTSVSINSKGLNNNSSNSDLSYHGDDDVGEDDNVGDDDMDYLEDEDGSNYDDNDDYLYDDGEDEYLKIQSQFDNVDLPTGVEVSLPWLKEPAPSGNVSGASSSSVNSKSEVCGFADTETKKDISSSGPPEGNESQAASILQRYKEFKQFDIVEDFSDHHYKGVGFTGKELPKNLGKKIQNEWKILEKDLPDTIFVRVYESRMDLLRAVIVGPSGTPYHDGIFVFDCLFPTNYPDSPPTVYYYSGGLRINPNLYECGKVCLSLLGTWSGKETEKWLKGKSTMLQVLVSIQALILNTRPFFNEPGHESFKGAEGDRQSNAYSENVFILSLKTMVYTLRRPPKHFEDFVAGHFHVRARDILVACEAYVNGATVACVDVENGVAHVRDCDKKGSLEFRDSVRKMTQIVITTFTRFGKIDCEGFQMKA